jgi:hypothetical protein
MSSSKCVECGGNPWCLDDIGVDANICGWCKGFLCPTHLGGHTVCQASIDEHNKKIDEAEYLKTDAGQLEQAKKRILQLESLVGDMVCCLEDLENGYRRDVLSHSLVTRATALGTTEKVGDDVFLGNHIKGDGK